MHLRPLVLLAVLGLPQRARGQYTATYNPSNLPPKTEADQLGTNQCGNGLSQESMCQNAYVNSVDDFCLWGPPYGGANSTIGETEPIVVAWCTKSGHGTRLIPDGTINGAHFVQTPDYVQVTGVGDLTGLNIPAGDTGGELDPHGADGTGNPKGGLVFGSSFGQAMQYHEWTNFMAHDEFCIRACRDGPNAPVICNHVYDVMGCHFNLPGNYDAGTFTSCDADSSEPMGVYGSSTWPPEAQHSGTNTPAPHPAPSSSSCTSVSSIANAVVIASGSRTGTSTSTPSSGSTTTGARTSSTESRTGGLPAQTSNSGGYAAAASPWAVCLVAVVVGIRLL